MGGLLISSKLDSSSKRSNQLVWDFSTEFHDIKRPYILASKGESNLKNWIFRYLVYCFCKWNCFSFNWILNNLWIQNMITYMNVECPHLVSWREYRGHCVTWSCSAERTTIPLTSPMMSPTCKRPCRSTAPPPRILATTNWPSSLLTVKPWLSIERK